MGNYVKKDWHQSPDPRKRLGITGEDAACAYFISLGYRIIDRNVRYSSAGELDIVAIDKNRLVFAEVKTRNNLKYGRPSLALTSVKQKTVRRLAEWYLKSHTEYKNLIPRIDVIELLFMPDGSKYINHIKSAF